MISPKCQAPRRARNKTRDGEHDSVEMQNERGKWRVNERARLDLVLVWMDLISWYYCNINLLQYLEQINFFNIDKVILNNCLFQTYFYNSDNIIKYVK